MPSRSQSIWSKKDCCELQGESEGADRSLYSRERFRKMTKSFMDPKIARTSFRREREVSCASVSEHVTVKLFSFRNPIAGFSASYPFGGLERISSWSRPSGKYFENFRSLSIFDHSAKL